MHLDTSKTCQEGNVNYFYSNVSKSHIKKWGIRMALRRARKYESRRVLSSMESE